MPLIRLVRRTPLPAAEAWRRLTDWPRHGTHTPLTRVTVTPPGPTGTGTLVVARTGVGRLAFDDPMEVTAWQPPTAAGRGFCRLAKRGTFVLGWAEIEVHAEGGGSHVGWREEMRVNRLPRALDAPTGWAGRLLFAHLLDALLRHPAPPRRPRTPPT
ncbi:SRPBCC family protein [Streptomyces sp. NPDC127098]|uniref:SRPBCC family protein n=1 Tax=Streptomyces sp. NPDC127098 TaxID=3347137 RepID=UPI0036515654